MSLPVVILVLMDGWSAVRTERGGLTVTSFRDLTNIQEIECSGRSVDLDADLMSMTFFTSTPKRVLGVINHGRGECSTAEVFVLCEVDPKDSRRTRIKALVYDIPAGTSRDYFCNVTSLKTGGWRKTFSWNITVISTEMSRFSDF
ncbi:hypothetical protein ACOMHN_036778 [Nucella lapillus]